jgi:hypothetical protein
MNFAVLDMLENYHTHADSLEYICLHALQNYGNTIFPMVQRYINNSRYSDMNAFHSNFDAVFFSYQPSMFISYNIIFSWIFIVISLLVVGYLIFILIKEKRVSFLKVLAAVGLAFGYLIVVAGLGLLISVIVGAISNVPFNLMSMMFVNGDRAAVVIGVILMVIIGVMIIPILKKLKISLKEYKIAMLLLYAVLLVFVAFVLHGGTFIFLWPLLFLGLASIFKEQRKYKFVQIILNVLVILFIVPIYISLAYAFFIALTVGALAVVLALGSLMISMAIISVIELYGLVDYQIKLVKPQVN